jgi:DNA-binding protein H-NS
MELAKMSLTELRRLQSKVETEIRRRNDSTRRDLLKKMQKMAADEGLSLSDLLPSAAAAEEKGAPSKRKAKAPAKAPAKKTGSVPVKYRNPENPEMGWSGRGRKPQWVISWLAQNKPLAELEVVAAK